VHPSGFVCVLCTPVRAEFDAACSILRHEGIAFFLRETRGGLVPYVVHDELRIFVAPKDVVSAKALIELLDEPSFPVSQPYRSTGMDDLEGADDLDEGAGDESDTDEPASASEEETEHASRTPGSRAWGALTLIALCALVVTSVMIGLVVAQRERLAPRGARVTPEATRWGAANARVLEGR
jgi:hypothetical protein